MEVVTTWKTALSDTFTASKHRFGNTPLGNATNASFYVTNTAFWLFGLKLEIEPEWILLPIKGEGKSRSKVYNLQFCFTALGDIPNCS